MLSAQQLAGFCPETLVVAAKYQQDFEKFGIHLQDSQQRSQVAQLLALNQHFPALFNATLVSPCFTTSHLCCCVSVAAVRPYALSTVSAHDVCVIQHQSRCCSFKKHFRVTLSTSNHPVMWCLHARMHHVGVLVAAGFIIRAAASCLPICLPG